MADRDAQTGRFLTGNNGGGRPRGSRNKLGEAFLEAMARDFDEGGIEAIKRVRMEDPSAYLRVVASTLPKEMRLESAPLAELSDDELARLLDLVRAVTAGDEPRTGTQTKGRAALTH